MLKPSKPTAGGASPQRSRKNGTADRRRYCSAVTTGSKPRQTRSAHHE
jgi:hypothetical protein